MKTKQFLEADRVNKLMNIRGMSKGEFDAKMTEYVGHRTARRVRTEDGDRDKTTVEAVSKTLNVHIENLVNQEVGGIPEVLCKMACENVVNVVKNWYGDLLFYLMGGVRACMVVCEKKTGKVIDTMVLVQESSMGAILLYPLESRIALVAGQDYREIASLDVPQDVSSGVARCLAQLWHRVKENQDALFIIDEDDDFLMIDISRSF